MQTQMLTALQVMTAQLADVKQWQRDLTVRLDLRATQTGLEKYKQVRPAGAIWSKVWLSVWAVTSQPQRALKISTFLGLLREFPLPILKKQP